MFENGEIKIVVLALDCLGLLLILLFVVDFALQQVVCLFLALLEKIRLRPLRLIVGSKQLVVSLP